jgi:hypothetical protein
LTPSLTLPILNHKYLNIYIVGRRVIHKVKNKLTKLTNLHKSEALKKSRFSRANLVVFAIIFASIGGYLIYSSYAAGNTCISATWYGGTSDEITYTFDKSYPCGTFANGDWWVAPNVGDTAVKVISITPDYAGGLNGWEVNPVNSGGQGFGSNIGDFSASLVPALPYNALPNKSLVKTIGVAGGCPNNIGCLQTAAVLTVLGNPPPDGTGNGYLRPAYPGTDKTLYSVSSFQTQLLPSLASPSGYTPPSISSIDSAIHRVQIDHKSGLDGRNTHPRDNMPDYGGDIAVNNNQAIGRLMFNDPLSAKMPLLIDTVQMGLDRYGAVLTGQDWPGGGGHMPGKRQSLAFTATMLNDTAMKNKLKTVSIMSDDQGVVDGQNGVALFGGFSQFNPVSDSEYWSYIAGSASFKEITDPYGYVDGGAKGTAELDAYQDCCLSEPWKGAALFIKLMPDMASSYGSNLNRFVAYSERWVNRGAHFSPDPCAPVAQGGGPDGPGKCILDPDLTPGSTMTNFSCQAGKQCGRFPSLDGADITGGGRKSGIVDKLWTTYYGTTNPTPPPPPQPPTPPPPPPSVPPGCTQSTTSWQNTAITPTQTSNFTFDYDATPQATGINAVVGLNNTAAAAYSDLAAIVRFNSSGFIDAADGRLATNVVYGSDVSTPYTAGTSYHFKLTINPTAHTYSVVVTPSGGSATTLATNYPFRTSQATLSTFSNWALVQDPASTGSAQVCGATLNQSTGPKQGDINNDNSVNITDLSLLLSSYNQNTTQCATNNTYKCDLSSPGDGVVNIFDLSILLSHYGT